MNVTNVRAGGKQVVASIAASFIGNSFRFDAIGASFDFQFINNGGPLANNSSFANGVFTTRLENYANSIGDGTSLQMTINGQDYQLDLLVHTIGSAPGPLLRSGIFTLIKV